VLQRHPAIYLQGSYRNATNIHGDSDVDIVVELETTFNRDVSSLDAEQVRFQANAYGPGTCDFQTFRAEVVQTLRNYYGAARVHERDRCIKVDFGTGRITADVVPALLHRKYQYFYTTEIQDKTDGIQFKNRAGVPIVNFPKQHISNGEAKNAANRTGERYKPTVRVFKNLRNRLIDDGTILADTAPSYSIECLLYNADDWCFAPSFQNSFTNIIANIGAKEPNQFICQNGIIPLFGNSPVQWSTQGAVQFLTAAQNLWNNWS
jgi:hypothetical protein